MIMRKLVLSLGAFAFIVSENPCFAAEFERICPSNLEDMLLNYEHKVDFDYDYRDGNNSSESVSNPSPKMLHSYKAAGKIYFLKKCADSETLCKTGSYIIAGDYFLALPEMNGYYCAIYMPDSYRNPKASGLIKGENFAETKLDEYEMLHYKNLAGQWENRYYNIAKAIGFSLESYDKGHISLFAQGSVIRHLGMDDGSSDIDLIEIDGYVFKTGVQSFVSPTTFGMFDIHLKAGKLILKKFGETHYSDAGAMYGDAMSKTYTYIEHPSDR